MELEQSTAEVEKALSSKDSLKSRFLKGDNKKFKKYYKSTTTHGVKHIFGGKSIIRRTFWALLFIGMLIGCIHGIVSSIIAYAKIPTSTTVYTDHVDQLVFPAVTICNLNGYNITYLEENNLTTIAMSAIYREGQSEGDFDKRCSSYLPPNYPNDTILYNTVEEASQPLEDLVADCHFLGQRCNFSLFEDYLTPTGRCFTFNGRSLYPNYMTVNGSGFRHDLELVLNVKQDEFVGAVTGEVGALVSIHEQDAPGLVWESGIPVPVGHSAYLAVTNEQIEDRTDRSFFDNDDLECIHKEEVPEFELFTSYNYSFRACRGECITQDLAQRCHCLWTNDEHPKYRNCNISDLCCIYDVLKYTTDCHCPVLCNHTSFEVVPSYSTYPSAKAVNADALSERFNVSREKLLTNYLKVHVFYKSLSISREITDRSYSFTELIANIGGNMGLFLGASIISLTEFFALIFDQIKDRLFGIRERKLKLAIDRYIAKKLRSKSYEPEKMSKDIQDSGISNGSYVDFDSKFEEAK